MVNVLHVLRGTGMRVQKLLLIGLALSLAGCSASPLYVGQWNKDRPSAPATVPRDDRGEPIMANLPPLGPLAIPTSSRANAESPQH
jgi:hypothetical protein